MIMALVFNWTLYGMAGMRHGGVYIMQNGLINMLVSLIAGQILHLAATLAPNQDLAFMLSIGWTAVNLVMSSFYLTFEEMSFGWISQLRYVSALYYAFEGLTTIEFKGRLFSCVNTVTAAQTALLPELLPNTPGVKSGLLATILNSDGKCVVNGNAVLTYFGFNQGVSVTVVLLLAYLVVMHVLTFGALLLLAKRERR